jgi:hypothetical protein
MRESLHPPPPHFIASSSWGTLSVGLVVVKVIIIIVSFLMLFALDAASFLALVLNPTACISVVDDIT